MEIPMEISKTHRQSLLPGGGGWQDDLASGAVRCPADVGKVWRQVRRPSDADLLGGRRTWNSLPGVVVLKVYPLVNVYITMENHHF